MVKSFFIICLIIAGGSAQAAINWWVVNRFPLISEEAFIRITEQVTPAAADLELQLTTIDYRYAVRHLDEVGAWNKEAQLYDAKKLLSPQAKIRATTSFEVGRCAWSLKSSADGVSNRTVLPCKSQFTSSLTIGVSHELSVINVDDGKYEAATVLVNRKLIVVVGDSFASGEGNPDYPALFRGPFAKQPPNDWAVDPGYPAQSILKESARWLDDSCHRSILSWPALYALRQAVVASDTVVQFATFACSGAEVLDGFIFPQQNPPGNIGAKIGGESTPLKYSQQHALAHLLCDGRKIERRTKEYIPDSLEEMLPRKMRWNYAQIYGCENPTVPDELLMLLGGNDARFSGVVMHVLHPQELGYSGLFGPLAQALTNFGIYKSLSPVSPQQAWPYINNLPQLYGWLQRGVGALQLTPERVRIRMLQYPNPSQSANPTARKEELLSCQLRTRDANRPVQMLIAESIPFRHEGALYGVSPTKLSDVSDTYVGWLQSAQAASGQKYGWELIASNPAFSGRGICAGSLECERSGQACAQGDRVRWAFWPDDSQYVEAQKSPHWGDLSSFRAYAVDRQRGMRYANDALLAMARFDADQRRIRVDWVTGMAHPTAEMHARIAAAMRAESGAGLSAR